MERCVLLLSLSIKRTARLLIFGQTRIMPDVWKPENQQMEVLLCLENMLSSIGPVHTLISLSSREAEYHGCVKAGSQALGLKSMLSDLGVTGKRLRVKTDASVAKSLASRRGLGGIRHIEVNQLWLQEKVNNGEIEIEKVMGVLNRADALTKPKDGKSLLQHLEWTSQVVTKGRNEHAPKLANTDPLDESYEGELDDE